MKTLIQSVFIAIAAIVILGLNSCKKSSSNSIIISQWKELGGTNTSPFTRDDCIKSIATDASGECICSG